jgi:hypothetical protein
MRLFQIVADNDPANSEVIILSGNFKVKKIALNQKHAFELSNGINSGTVDMEAEGALRIPATTGYIRPMASILHEFRQLWLPIPTWTTFL